MIKNKHIKELINGTVVSFGTRVLAFGLGYLFFIFLGQYYGSEGVGLYAFSFTLLSIIGMVASMGTNTYLLRQAGKYGTSDVGIIFEYFKKILYLTLPISILLGLILIVLSRFFAITIFKDVSLVYSFIAVGIVLPFYMYLQLSSAFFRGLKKVFLSEFFQMFGMHLVNFLLLVSLIIFATLRESFDVLALFVTTFLVISSIALTLVIRARKKVVASSKIDMTYRELVEDSWPMMVSALSMLLLGSIDNLMLGLYVPISQVGEYAIAIKIATVSSIVLAAMNTMMAPKISELFHNNSGDELKILIRFSSKVLMSFSVFTLAIIIFFSSELLSLFGPEFESETVVMVLLIVSLAQFFNSISGSVGNMMNMTGNQKPFRTILLIALGLKIILNLVLIPLYGLIGAAVASLLSTMLWNFYLVYFIKREYNIFTIYVPNLFFKRVV